MRSATTPWFRFNFADELVKRSPTDRQLEDQPTDATFNDAHHCSLCVLSSLLTMLTSVEGMDDVEL
jgi:hypothetical protein